MKPARQVYPRVNCLVAGCKRGTTRYPPHDDGGVPEIICGKHWRTVPKSWRTAMSFVGRRCRAAERKGDTASMERALRLWWSQWGRIVAVLNNPEDAIAGELPPTLAEGLRAHGLL